MACLAAFPNVLSNLKTFKKDVVEAVHKFVFETKGDRNNRQRLREFKGFNATGADEQFERKCGYINQNLNAADMMSICFLLELDYNVGNLKRHIFNNLITGQLLKDVRQEEEEEEDDGANLTGQDDIDDIGTTGENATMNESQYTDAHTAIHNGCTRDDDNLSVTHDDVSLTGEHQFISGRSRQATHTIRHNEINVGNSQSRFSLNFRDVEDSVRSFDGNGTITVEIWVQEFEEMAAMMQWDQLQMVIFAKKSLKGLAKLFVQSERNLTTWLKLRKALLDEFTRKVNSAQIHKMLSERKMNKDENVHQYYYKMREIAAQGHVEDDALIQHVIDGIKDIHSNKALLYGANNIQEFKEKLRTYDVFTSKQRNFVEARTVEKIPLPQVNKTDSKWSVQCYNCGKKGHVSQNCQYKSRGTKCFNCNKFGHMAKDCKTKTYEDETKNVRCMTVGKDLMMKHIQILNQNDIALFDTGSKVNIMKFKVYERLKAPKLKKSTILLTGFGERSNKIRPIGNCTVDVIVDDDVFELEFQIIPNDYMDVDIVIGYPICLQAEVTINANGVRIRKLEIIKMMNIELEDEKDFEGDIEISASNKAKESVKELVKNYVPNKKKTNNVSMKIILTDETPICSRPRRLPFDERELVDTQIDQWMKEGIIEDSESEFSSPIVLVAKKDGSKRLCVDYRKINKVIVRDRFPLPLIEDQLDRLQDATIFSVIDLKNAFFHVPIDEPSRKYTSFVTHNGQYNFRYVPFGLSNSPPVFQRYIYTMFRELTRRGIALPYVDDVIIPAKTEEEALNNLKEVFELCQDFGLNLNLKKCKFLKKRIEFLGHLIENHTISPSPAKVKAMLNYPLPKTLKQVESFLGLAGYFRKFIRNFAQIAKPLSDLKKKDVKFTMGDKEIMSFNSLKKMLSKGPVLKIYNQLHETELHTDASIDGYGAILMQRCLEDGELHPVQYMSKKTTEAERKYTSYELEILAVVQAVKKFRVYLLGIDFKLVTDCNAFATTMAKKDLSTRVSRWLLLLQEYQYRIEHRSGTRMRHVDALSRNIMMIREENILTKMGRAQKMMRICN